MIPYNVNYKSYTRETYQQIKSNLVNSFKNAAACVSGSLFSINFLHLCFCSLSTLASANSVPGVTTLYEKSLVQKIRDVKQIFCTQSIKPDSLVAPFRQMALDLYIHMNDAIAKFVICMFSTFSCILIVCILPSGETRRILERSPRSLTKHMFWRCLRLLKLNMQI